LVTRQLFQAEVAFLREKGGHGLSFILRILNLSFLKSWCEKSGAQMRDRRWMMGSSKSAGGVSLLMAKELGPAKIYNNVGQGALLDRSCCKTEEKTST
jgi:hypothetical protein